VTAPTTPPSADQGESRDNLILRALAEEHAGATATMREAKIAHLSFAKLLRERAAELDGIIQA
jgi:hypothetical protein